MSPLYAQVAKETDTLTRLIEECKTAAGRDAEGAGRDSEGASSNQWREHAAIVVDHFSRISHALHHPSPCDVPYVVTTHASDRMLTGARNPCCDITSSGELRTNLTAQVTDAVERAIARAPGHDDHGDAHGDGAGRAAAMCPPCPAVQARAARHPSRIINTFQDTLGL